MKQGSATSSKMGSTKVEPMPKAVSPGAVSSIGIQTMRTVSKPMYEGRGLKAPMAKETRHPSGSQGKR